MNCLKNRKIFALFIFVIFLSGYSYAEQGNKEPLVCLKSKERGDFTFRSSAPVDIDMGNITDFQLGQKTQHALSCPRVFVDMNHIEQTNTFGGKLYIIYDEGDDPHTYKYDSGDSIEDNQYNSWYGSWHADSSGVMNAKFSAIFQRDMEDMAIILQINKVVQTDKGGHGYLKGSGDIWFKTFRTATHYPYRRHDVCLHDGQYLKFSSIPLPIPRWKCWLLAVGPYSCLPDGVDADQLDFQREQVLIPKNRKSIDIRSEPPCYSKFGTFENLDIKKAFNVSADRSYP